jgi:uncharacterized protein
MSIAIVTGAAGGLGEAFARALARRGHDLVLVDLRREALSLLTRRLARDPGVAVEAIGADLSRRADVERVAGHLEKMGDVELLVNNAGFGKKGRIDTIDAGEQLAQVDVMVGATVRLSRAVLPGLVERGRGAIINVSSVGAFNPGTDWAIYGASKRFLLDYTESLALELAGTGVRAQALCPGYIHTGFHDASGTPEAKAAVPDTVWMTPDEVAEASLEALNGSRVVVIPGARHYLHLATTYSDTLRRVVFAALRRIEGSRSWL